jgi:hypothetical protein
MSPSRPAIGVKTDALVGGQDPGRSGGGRVQVLLNRQQRRRDE